jgi:hypothetical protein
VNNADEPVMDFSVPNEVTLVAVDSTEGRVRTHGWVSRPDRHWSRSGRDLAGRHCVYGRRKFQAAGEPKCQRDSQCASSGARGSGQKISG